MHAWIPRKLRLVPGAGEMPTVEFSTFHNVRYDWFHEGFTEYLARILLVRIGLVPQDWFGEQLNQELARLAMHPYRTISTDELEEAVRRKRFTNFHQRIGYHRGFVIAFNLDAAVRRASADSSSLVNVIRRLLTLASDSGTLTRDDLVAAFRERGVDASGIVEKQALRGMPMLPDSTGLGPEWVLRFRERAAFDAGFDVVTSITNSMAIGVEQGGAAHAAGLREGMRIERVVNGMPWSDDWNPDLPTTGAFYVQLADAAGSATEAGTVNGLAFVGATVPAVVQVPEPEATPPTDETQAPTNPQPEADPDELIKIRLAPGPPIGPVLAALALMAVFVARRRAGFNRRW